MNVGRPGAMQPRRCGRHGALDPAALHATVPHARPERAAQAARARLAFRKQAVVGTDRLVVVHRHHDRDALRIVNKERR